METTQKTDRAHAERLGRDHDGLRRRPPAAAELRRRGHAPQEQGE